MVKSSIAEDVDNLKTNGTSIKRFARNVEEYKGRNMLNKKKALPIFDRHWLDFNARSMADRRIDVMHTVYMACDDHGPVSVFENQKPFKTAPLPEHKKGMLFQALNSVPADKFNYVIQPYKRKRLNDGAPKHNIQGEGFRFHSGE